MQKVCFVFIIIVMFFNVKLVQAIDLIAGKEYFLRTPLYAAKDKDNYINWVNYSDAAEKLHAGGKVTVTEINGHAIKFVMNNKMYLFEYEQKGHVGSPGIYDKYFTAANIREDMQRYDEHIRTNISLGKIELGMTKEEVLLAVGCPPIADIKKTYDLSLQDILHADSWIYYRSRLKKLLLNFAAGKVISIEEQ
ncbi:MAG TPA: hypothetical protein VK452_02510 [Dissulfurispiraceae bacterium]|nr:hypothetical protein [Dissulfurispiraceae bacterium]